MATAEGLERGSGTVVELHAEQPLGITLPQSLRAPARAEAVHEGSAAETAGVKLGDAIVSVGDVTAKRSGRPLTVRECMDAVKSCSRPVNVVFIKQAGDWKEAGSPSSSVHNGATWIASRLSRARTANTSNAPNMPASASSSTAQAEHENSDDTTVRIATLRSELEEVSEQLRDTVLNNTFDGQQDSSATSSNATATGLDALSAKLRWAVNETFEAEKETARLSSQAERCTAAEEEAERLAKLVENEEQLNQRIQSLEKSRAEAEHALEEARTEARRMTTERDEAQSEQASASCRAQMAEQDATNVREELEEEKARVADLEAQVASAKKEVEDAKSEAQSWEEEAKAQRQRADINAQHEKEINSLKEEVRLKDEQLRDAMEETEKLAKRAANAEKQAVSAKGSQRDRRNLAEERDRLQAEADSAKQQLKVMEELLQTERRMRSQAQQQQHNKGSQSNSVHNGMQAFTRLASRTPSSSALQNSASMHVNHGQHNEEQNAHKRR